MSMPEAVQVAHELPEGPLLGSAPEGVREQEEETVRPLVLVVPSQRLNLSSSSMPNPSDSLSDRIHAMGSRPLSGLLLRFLA